MVGEAPDFEIFRTAMMRRAEPPRVPLAEVGVDIEVMEAFIGHPIRDLRSYTSFWTSAGYDYVLLQVRGQPLPDSDQIRITEGQLRWTRSDRTVSTFSKSQIEDERSLESYPWIRPSEVYYRDVDSMENHIPQGMKLVVNHGPVFQSLIRTMGLETLSIASVENPALVRAVAQKVGELSVDIVKNLVQRDWVGAVWLGDDIAYTGGLMISPAFLRRHIFPYYRRIGDLCRHYEKLFLFHSDGNLTEVFEDLIACGVHAIHPNEPTSVDIVKLKRQWADRLSFIGNIDVDVLTRGSRDQVVKATRHLVEHVAPGGGFALGSGNSITRAMPLENYTAMLQTVRDYHSTRTQ